MATSDGGSVTVQNRLGAIGNAIPAIAGAALAEGRAAAEEWLQANAPEDTGQLKSEIYGVSNQYTATITSAVYYTTFQEFGFWNVWAGRWIPGRFFMLEAAVIMQEVTEAALYRRLGAL